MNPWLQILSFLVPLLGLIIYFVYRTIKPSSANSAIQAAAWGFIFNFVLMLARGMRH
ncbi:hypothetical protein IAD21_02442 [Abditibacteriota bacterium]|nr:hypothetical protein IAD21_02442 [Abditibacteriota bacterium]